MIFALLATSLVAGFATIMIGWPLAGAWALAAGPVGASLATLAVAVLIARRPVRGETDDLDRLSDRLVADLRGIVSAPQTGAAAQQRLRRSA